MATKVKSSSAGRKWEEQKVRKANEQRARVLLVHGEEVGGSRGYKGGDKRR